MPLPTFGFSQAVYQPGAPLRGAGILCAQTSTRLVTILTDNLTENVETVLQAVLAAWSNKPGGLLPALREAQIQLGYVPPDRLDLFADAFNLSRAEVHGVLSFYHDFRTSPPSRHTVRLCRAEACQAVGAETLAAALEQACATAFGTDSAGGVSLETVYCFGNCAVGPTAEVDGRLIGPVAADRILALLEVE